MKTKTKTVSAPTWFESAFAPRVVLLRAPCACGQCAGWAYIRMGHRGDMWVCAWETAEIARSSRCASEYPAHEPYEVPLSEAVDIANQDRSVAGLHVELANGTKVRILRREP